MKKHLTFWLCLTLSMLGTFACNRTEIDLPAPAEQEETVFLIQMGNRFAAYDWIKSDFKWTINPVAPTQFVKPEPPSRPAWYQIGPVPRVALQSWADSSKGSTESPSEFITIFDPHTGQRSGGVPNKLTPDFYIEKPMSEIDGAPLDGRISSVAIVDDKAIVVRRDQQRDKPTNSTIHAIELGSGKIIWTYHVPDQDILTTSFQGGKMLVGCNNSTFVVDLATGRKVKDYPMAAGRVAGEQQLFFWTYGKKLIIADLISGKTKWEMGTDGGTDQVGEFLVSGQTALVTFNGQLHAVDLASGIPKWTFADLKANHYVPRSRIVADKDVVYVIDQQLRINALDLNTGMKKWQSVSFRIADFDGSDMSMIAGRRKLYVQHRRDQIIALNPENGDYTSADTFWSGDQGLIRDFMILY